MQALRVARPRVSLRALQQVKGVRAIAATANASHATQAATAGSSGSSAVIPLTNVEAQWEALSADEQLAVHNQLEEIQKRDWRTLSIDEKKAAYYVAFGPHGPRAAVNPPGTTLRLLIGTLGLVGASAALYFGFRAICKSSSSPVSSRSNMRSFSLFRISRTAPAPPRTINKEWEEASNQRAIDQKMDPINGLTREGYTGTGFVQHK
ncbi:hypothetical protein NLI96_g6961 [Meripilus lineatus]|uniref:Cytochrome c oxidase subunit IV n=1 Tax=Meripilus lineatus TaxID=2056292 RepID=A0AAD5UZX8_9APHY|nr:hypothetical protein NLI96_g6961 [Physisporinus lineatus]